MYIEKEMTLCQNLTVQNVRIRGLKLEINFGYENIFDTWDKAIATVCLTYHWIDIYNSGFK